MIIIITGKVKFDRGPDQAKKKQLVLFEYFSNKNIQ